MTRNLPVPAPQNPGEFVLYQSEDGRTRLEVRLTGETVWLALNQMADLFQRDKSVISRHISNLFDEGELRREGVVAVFATTAADGPRKTDVGIAKNYLNQEEFEALNLIVSAYLDFAELQARSRRPMHMADWIAKLDDFLRLTERDILTHAGRVSHSDAVARAEAEFERYRQIQAALPQPVDQHFDQTLEELKRIEQQGKAPRKKGAEKKPTRKKPKPPRSGGEP